MAIDVRAMWVFADPAESERRFREAMTDASAADQAILLTQIARTYGLRKNFDAAREVLDTVDRQISPEAEVRWNIEMGRTICSAAHDEALLTREERERAAQHYGTAFENARTNALDFLAIDALHMMVFTEIDPIAQARWNEEAVHYLEISQQSDAKTWEGSLRNNLGCALQDQRRYAEALHQFELALAFRRREGNPELIRIAEFMVAKTLRLMGRISEATEIQLRLHQEAPENPYISAEIAELKSIVGP